MNIKFDRFCPLCNSKNTKILLSSTEFHGSLSSNSSKIFSYYKCRKCSAVYLFGENFDERYLNTYYSHGYYSDNKAFKKFIGLLIRKIPDYFKEKIILNGLTTKKNIISILDIGMGKGEFLNNLRDRRFKRYGIDLKPGLEYSEKIEKIYDGDFLAEDFKKKFDVVSMWHVLEHTPDPEKIVKKIKLILKKNGVLIFSTPNTGSLGFYLAKEYWFHLDPPRHVILYNKENTMKLCRDCGFSKVNVINGFMEYPTDLFWSVKHKKVRFIIYPLYPLFKLVSRDTLIFICQK